MSYVERNKEDLLSRLKKIEGQIRGIQKMIEEDRYCVDILLQISATRAALQKVALSLLRSHTRGCVARAIRENRGDEVIDELMQVLDQFTR
ncbi:MAG: metal-sensitive transcriptional regulator [Thermoanaerobacter sp.]|nr:metal-sensitive transcriptional regulator [Thermoanaerobacter sp.]